MTRNFPSGLGNLLDIPQWRSILYDSVGAVEMAIDSDNSLSQLRHKLGSAALLELLQMCPRLQWKHCCTHVQITPCIHPAKDS